MALNYGTIGLSYVYRMCICYYFTNMLAIRLYYADIYIFFIKTVFVQALQHLRSKQVVKSQLLQR